MFHLILKLVPASVHRALLPIAHRIRRRWRMFRKVPLRGVSVILTDDKGRVLLLRHSYGRPVWALTGGGLSLTENAEEGARREVFEELGLEIGELTLLQELDEVISGSPHTAYVYAAHCNGTPTPDQREILEARFFARDALPDNLSALTLHRLALLDFD
ncbi:MAG: NUDIX domain-containing protein [Erythrobacter sp.]